MAPVPGVPWGLVVPFLLACGEAPLPVIMDVFDTTIVSGSVTVDGRLELGREVQFGRSRDCQKEIIGRTWSVTTDQAGEFRLRIPGRKPQGCLQVVDVETQTRILSSDFVGSPPLDSIRVDMEVTSPR